MASFIDTIRTVFGSKYVALKLVTISGIFAYPFYQIVLQFDGWTSTWTIATIVALIFYIGYILNASHNLINEVDILLPGFLNPFKIFAIGLGGILALGPMITLMAYVGYCLYMIFIQKELSMSLTITGIAIAEVFLLGVLAVQLTLYTSSFNPFKSYHLIKLLKAFPEFTLKSIILFIGLTLFGGIILGPLGYLTALMFGFEGIFVFVMILFLTVLLLFATQYYSQLFMESFVLVGKVEYEEDAGQLIDQDKLDQ